MPNFLLKKSKPDFVPAPFLSDTYTSMADIPDKILEMGTSVTFYKGDVMFQNEYLVSDPSAHLILSGRVELVKKYTPLVKDEFIFESGSIVGILEVYTGTARLTTATALTDVKAVGFNKAQLEKAMSANLSLALSGIRQMSGMLRVMNERIKTLQ